MFPRAIVFKTLSFVVGKFEEIRKEENSILFDNLIMLENFLEIYKYK